MKRSTGASRIASRRICVPSTFVVTNSRAPSAIDFSTCDSAAAFTITSTPSTTSRTSSPSRMSPCTKESRSCEITSARFSMLPAYVSASSETTSYGVDRSRWRMKFDEMKPAPPVTRTRFWATAPKATGRDRPAARCLSCPGVTPARRFCAPRVTPAACVTGCAIRYASRPYRTWLAARASGVPLRSWTVWTKCARRVPVLRALVASQPRNAFQGSRVANGVRLSARVRRRLQLLIDRVQRAALDVALDAGEVLADQREDEALRSEHDEDRDPQQQGPGEVGAVDPVPERIHAEDRREQGAESADRQPRPLDRPRPETGQHMEREAREPQRRVPRPAGARSVRDVDLDDARAAREDERLGELLPADHAEHRFHGAPAVRVEGAPEVGDRDAREAPQHAVDQARRQRPAPRIVPRRPPPARHVGTGLDGRNQLRDVLRCVLEVTVHGHEDVAGRECEPRVHRGVLPEVPLEADAANPVVRSTQALDLGPGPIRGPVVHENQLVRPLQLLQRSGRTGVELGDRSRLLEHR